VDRGSGDGDRQPGPQLARCAHGDDFPHANYDFRLGVTIRGIVQTARTINLSIRDVSNTANILCTVAVVIPNTTAATFVVEGTWTDRPAWLANNKTLALYIDGGNGADDYIVKQCTLWWRSY
jgi:hypothetical protein